MEAVSVLREVLTSDSDWWASVTSVDCCVVHMLWKGSFWTGFGSIDCEETDSKAKSGLHLSSF